MPNRKGRDLMNSRLLLIELKEEIKKEIKENKAFIGDLKTSNQKFLEDIREDNKVLINSKETEIGKPLKGPDEEATEITFEENSNKMEATDGKTNSEVKVDDIGTLDNIGTLVGQIKDEQEVIRSHCKKEYSRRGNNIVSAEGDLMCSKVRQKFEKRSSIQEAQLTWTQESEILRSASIQS
jgi:hypothetical protein